MNIVYASTLYIDEHCICMNIIICACLFQGHNTEEGLLRPLAPSLLVVFYDPQSCIIADTIVMMMMMMIIILILILIIIIVMIIIISNNNR